MIKSNNKLSFAWAAASLWLVASVALTNAIESNIVLPEDVDLVNIQGNGFNLQLTQISQIKEKWQKLTDEAAAVEAPRHIDGKDDAKKVDARINVNLFEKIIAEQKRLREQGSTQQESNTIDPSARYLGSLYAYTRPDFDNTRRVSQELSDWIKARAELILRRYESYGNDLDIMDQKKEPGRVIVLHILLLNTYVDLENISKEEFDGSYSGVAWLKKALKQKVNQFRYNNSMSAIKDWLEQRFAKVRENERKNRETNYEWMANMRDIKRFLHEEKFSEELADKCSKFLAEEWQGFPRIYRLETSQTSIGDGRQLQRIFNRLIPNLFPVDSYGGLYNAFGGQFAFELPFSVQDSVLRGY